MKNSPKKINPYLLFWGVAGVTLILDQLTKAMVRLADQGLVAPLFWRLTDSFDIVFVKNTGAAWGVWSGAGPLLGLLAVVALGAIYFLRDVLQLKRVSMQWAFGLLVAGIAGNMIDRLFLGFVVDFVDISFGGYHFPSFNLADCAITTGVMLYVIFGALVSSISPTAEAPTSKSAE